MEVRKTFVTLKKNLGMTGGILDSPTSLTYKVFLVGRAGSGKTFFTGWLGRRPPNMAYYPTLGTTMTLLSMALQQPMDTVVNLELWESGSNAKRTTEDLLADCPPKVDALILFFSFSEKESFLFLPTLVNAARQSMTDSPELCILAVGNFWNLEEPCAVTQKDIQSFEKTWNVPVFFVPTSAASWTDPMLEDKKNFFIGLLIEHLMLRDDAVGLSLQRSSSHLMSK